MADGEGFEPSVENFPTTPQQGAAFDLSANHPDQGAMWLPV